MTLMVWWYICQQRSFRGKGNLEHVIQTVLFYAIPLKLFYAIPLKVFYAIPLKLFYVIPTERGDEGSPAD